MTSSGTDDPNPGGQPELDGQPELVGPPARGGQPALGEHQRRILEFERRWWRHPGAKEQAIRDTFELSATRYYQLLNAVLDDPAALAHDPVLVGRLRRLRDGRAAGGSQPGHS